MLESIDLWRSQELKGMLRYKWNLKVELMHTKTAHTSNFFCFFLLHHPILIQLPTAFSFLSFIHPLPSSLTQFHPPPNPRAHIPQSTNPPKSKKTILHSQLKILMSWHINAKKLPTVFKRTHQRAVKSPYSMKRLDEDLMLFWIGEIARRMVDR